VGKWDNIIIKLNNFHYHNEAKLVIIFFLILIPLASFAESQSTYNPSFEQSGVGALSDNDFCGNGMEPIELLYSFTGDGKIRTICSVPESRSIVIRIDVFEKDSLRINIPKKIINELGICNPKHLANSLFVLVDGQEERQKLFVKKMDYDLIIDVQKDTKLIEFFGTINTINPTLACLPPKIQQKVIGSDNVQCQDGLIRIKKISDGSMACVTPETLSKLVMRGWGIK